MTVWDFYELEKQINRTRMHLFQMSFSFHFFLLLFPFLLLSSLLFSWIFIQAEMFTRYYFPSFKIWWCQWYKRSRCQILKGQLAVLQRLIYPPPSCVSNMPRMHMHKMENTKLFYYRFCWACLLLDTPKLNRMYNHHDDVKSDVWYLLPWFWEFYM